MPRSPVFAAALFALLSAMAPGAAAQPLVTVRGSAIAYRVDVPLGWEQSGGDDLMVGRDSVFIAVSATDLVPLQKTPLPGSVGEQRRLLTQRFMHSDTVMMAIVSRVARNLDLAEDGRVLEVRTLGGQRAAYMSGRPVQSRMKGMAHVYFTVKDGVMYLLTFNAMDTNPEKHQDLFDRVHRSFVLAEAPPS
jgi:hypothetical protein